MPSVNFISFPKSDNAYGKPRANIELPVSEVIDEIVYLIGLELKFWILSIAKSFILSTATIEH